VETGFPKRSCKQRTISAGIDHVNAILKTGIDHGDNDKQPQTLTRAAAAKRRGGAPLQSPREQFGPNGAGARYLRPPVRSSASIIHYNFSFICLFNPT
jgi:hypothetical protein